MIQLKSNFGNKCKKTRMTASYKDDDGQNYSSQCFPARTSSIRRKRQGGGHWLAAYRIAEEENYRHLYKKVKEIYKKHNEITESYAGRTLDKDLLLRLHCADEPFELSLVDISEQDLNAVKDEDFNLFENVFHIDASINFLSVGHFRSFASLRELNLSLNKLQDVTFDPADFSHLQVLDLSYNSLSGEAVAAIGRLPRLRVLHLTGNQLHHLPSDLSSSNQDPTQTPASEEDTNFKCLEVLMLDDNKLSNGVFSSLAKLKRLKYLNLQGNLIFEVPLLEVRQFLTMSSENKEADGNTSDNPMKLAQQKEWVEYKESSFPFSELQFLNLSGNNIAEEEALLAVALFPKLCEIDIRANPLATQRSGDPPLLTHYLQDRLGVKIKRNDEPEPKTSLNISVRSKRKGKV